MTVVEFEVEIEAKQALFNWIKVHYNCYKRHFTNNH